MPHFQQFLAALPNRFLALLRVERRLPAVSLWCRTIVLTVPAQAERF
jgi:hypothetical protein